MRAFVVVDTAVLRRALSLGTPYALAVLGVALATAVRLYAGAWLAEDPSVLFLAAISLSAWRGGLGPGIVAVALSALAQARYFIAPDALLLATSEQAFALAVSSIEGLLVCAILHALRTRTADLAQANDELRREAAERARVEEHLRQAQKMESLGRLAGGIAHDFNNVLLVILGIVAMNAEDLPPGEARDDFLEIGKAAERAAALVRQLLAFSRQQVFEPKMVDLRELVGEMDKMLQRLTGPSIRFAVKSTVPIASVRIDPSGMGQVVMNLVANARDAMPNGGTLTIETANVTFDDSAAARSDVGRGPYVMLAVSDTGIGMDAATRARVFEPFFTTKERGRGTGLGLATVFGIVKQAGGVLDVESAPGAGTTFRIYLPAVDAPPESIAVVEAAAVAAGTETVLLVDDEDEVRRVTRSILERSGYRVLEAVDGTDALHVYDAHRGEIDLVLTDRRMPQMDGRELARRLSSTEPQLRVMWMSGYFDLEEEAPWESAVPQLQKPFTPQALTTKLRDVLDTPWRNAPASRRNGEPALHGH